MQSTWYIHTTSRGTLGPFPIRHLQQYIVLGRLDAERAQISQDGENWVGMRSVAAFSEAGITAVAGVPDTPERMLYIHEADERSDGDRRRGESAQDAGQCKGQQERRSGKVRRAPEPSHMLTARKRRPQPAKLRPIARAKVWTGAGIGLLAFMVVLLLVTQVTDTASIGIPRNCQAAPLPRINWNGCIMREAKLRGVDLREAFLVETNFVGADLSRARLDSANLSYAKATGANLSRTQLTRAQLIGTNLERANLRRAKFDGADLRSANLTGARITGASFDGARLDAALWVDGSECAKGSVGRCARTN